MLQGVGWHVLWRSYCGRNRRWLQLQLQLLQQTSRQAFYAAASTTDEQIFKQDLRSLPCEKRPTVSRQKMPTAFHVKSNFKSLFMTYLPVSCL